MNYSPCKANFSILSNKGRLGKKGFKEREWNDTNALKE